MNHHLHSQLLLLCTLFLTAFNSCAETETTTNNQAENPPQILPPEEGEEEEEPDEPEIPEEEPAYPDINRLLNENIIKIYYSDEPQPAKTLTLVDFSSPEYTDNTSSEYQQIGAKSLKWNYGEKDTYNFNIPHDLTAYSTLGFWLYTPSEAVGATFQLYFLSENSETDKMDYYGVLVKMNSSGWNHYQYQLANLPKTRDPLGWNKIDKLVFTSSGWNQTNNSSTTIYIDNLQLFSPQISYEETKDHVDLLVDFANSSFANNNSADFVHEGSKSLKWSYSKKSFSIKVPTDLSGYEVISFWVYVPPEFEKPTFYMYFKSESPDDEDYSGMDYYGRLINLPKSGWNQIVMLMSDFAANRHPRGWDQIDNLIIDCEGWSQKNSKETTIYLDNIYLHTSRDILLPELPKLPGSLFSLNGNRAIIDNQLINAGFDNDPEAIVFKKDGEYWLPLTVLGARYDENSFYNPKQQILEMTIKGKHYYFHGGQDNVTINEEFKQLDFNIAVKGQSLFAPLSYFQELMGYKNCFIDDMGLIYLSNEEREFTDFDDILALIHITMLSRPSGAEIISTINSRHGPYGHPRVMLTAKDFDYMKKLLNKDERFTSYFNALVEKYGPGSSQFNDEPVNYKLTDGVRLLARSQEAKNRMVPWALLYNLTGDARYVMRLWDEIDALNNFPSWHPVHFLDTAEIMFAIAIAYDWLYDIWTPRQREQMEKAMWKMGLSQALDRYEGRAPIWGNNNWAGVCNGGIIAAALAFANAPATAAGAQKALEYGLKNVADSLFTYAPDGGYLESPSYWYYGTSYIHVLISSLESAIGSSLGLYYSPGFADSAYFINNMESTAGTWGFHDSSTGRTNNNLLYWFSRKSNDTTLAHLRDKDLTAGNFAPNIFDMLWYKPELLAGGADMPNKLDAYYSKVGSVTMHSGNEKNLFTGLHGGKNNVNHGDLDIGNFIIYGGDKQYIMELGSDNYNLPNYFGDSRHHYYRKRAEGQNTLVIGESSYSKPDQTKNANSSILRFESNNQTGALAVVDMTPAYSTVRNGVRGLRLTNQRQVIVIQDEIELTNPEIVRWAIHTEANITIAADGRSARLQFEKSDEYLYAEIVSDDQNLKFINGPAVSYAADYPSSFSETQKEYDRDNITKLMIITNQPVSDFNVAVAFKLCQVGEAASEYGEIYSWTDISDWNIE